MCSWKKAPLGKLCGTGGSNNYGQSKRSTQRLHCGKELQAYLHKFHICMLLLLCACSCFLWHIYDSPFLGTGIYSDAPKSCLRKGLLGTVFQIYTLPAVNVAKPGLLLRSRNYRQGGNKFCRWLIGQPWHHMPVFHLSIRHNFLFCFSFVCKIFKGLFLFKKVEHYNVFSVHEPVSTPACQYSNYYQTV